MSVKVDQKIIEKTVKETLADTLDIKIDKINNTSSLVEDLGADSFNAVEILYVLEQKFKIDIPKTVLIKVNKVQDMIDYLSKHLQEKK